MFHLRKFEHIFNVQKFKNKRVTFKFLFVVKSTLDIQISLLRNFNCCGIDIENPHDEYSQWRLMILWD